MLSWSEKNTIRLIVSMHVAGLLGFVLAPEYFVPLTAFNLIFGSYLVLRQPLIKKEISITPLLLLLLCGFAIEVAGVKTGLLFGEYQYGKAFGIKFLEVPVLIGLNWAMLIFCSITLLKKFKFKPITTSFLVALLLTGIDFFIEQTAMKYDFWYWKNGIIPIQNYLAWFVVSFFLTFIFQSKINCEHKKYSVVYLLCQLVFFIGLYINKIIF